MHPYVPSCSAVLVALLIAAGCPAQASAAPGYDNCTGFVRLDADGGAQIAAPGTWCLDQDLQGPLQRSNRLEIASDDVVLDCKGFRVRGNPAHPRGSNGIRAEERSRLTIRNCVIEHAYHGIQVVGFVGRQYGVLVEDNVVLDSDVAIEVIAVDTVVRRNRIRKSDAGILASKGHILDNIVDGATDYGIAVIHPVGHEIRGNTVRLATGGAEPAAAIKVLSLEGIENQGFVSDNVIVGVAGSVGIHCSDTVARFADNVFTGVAVVNDGCTDAGGNDVSP